MSEASNNDGIDGVAGDRPPQCARDHGGGDAGEVRERPGCGVCGGVRAGVLETEVGQVGPVPRC